jgi:hypothetical protein
MSRRRSMLSCRRRYEQYAAAASLKNSANSRTTPCASVIPPARSAASNSSCTDCTGTGSTVNEGQASDRSFRFITQRLSERLLRVARLRVWVFSLICRVLTRLRPRSVRGEFAEPEPVVRVRHQLVRFGGQATQIGVHALAYRGSCAVRTSFGFRIARDSSHPTCRCTSRLQTERCSPRSGIHSGSAHRRFSSLESRHGRRRRPDFRGLLAEERKSPVGAAAFVEAEEQDPLVAAQAELAARERDLLR